MIHKSAISQQSADMQIPKQSVDIRKLVKTSQPADSQRFEKTMQIN